MDVLSQKSSKSSVVFSISCFMLCSRIKLYASASKYILSSVFTIPMTTSFSIWNCYLNIPNGPLTLDFGMTLFIFLFFHFVGHCFLHF